MKLIPDGWSVEYGDTSVGEAYGPFIYHTDCPVVILEDGGIEQDTQVELIDKQYMGDGMNRMVNLTFTWTCGWCGAVATAFDHDWDPTDEALEAERIEGERLANEEPYTEDDAANDNADAGLDDHGERIVEFRDEDPDTEPPIIDSEED